MLRIVLDILIFKAINQISNDLIKHIPLIENSKWIIVELRSSKKVKFAMMFKYLRQNITL